MHRVHLDVQRRTRRANDHSEANGFHIDRIGWKQHSMRCEFKLIRNFVSIDQIEFATSHEAKGRGKNGSATLHIEILIFFGEIGQICARTFDRIN